MAGVSGTLANARWLHNLERGRSLEHVPKELVVDFVVKLHFGGFDDGAQRAGAAIRGRPLQVGKARFYIAAKELRGPLGFLKVIDGGVNVVGKVAFGRAQVLDFRGLSL